jgi:hypothetical protein
MIAAALLLHGFLGGGVLTMADALFVLLTLALVALSVAYTRACDKV